MNGKIELLGLFPRELAEFVAGLGEAPYRAKQLYAALADGKRFSGMTNLPKSLREKLEKVALDNSVTLKERARSKIDDTQKLLFALVDENIVEGVLMRHHHGNTFCLSTQVGCAMGCAFCASTLEGCVRNMTAAEMMGQVLIAKALLAEDGHRLGNVVLMGSGEPFMNYDQVVRWIRLSTDERGLNLSVRGISLSTCGLADKIDAFSEEGLPVTLCVSLHAPNDEIRSKIMPVAERFPIDDILAACRRYIGKTGRRVIFEYALIEGVNCAPRHADELAARLRNMQCHVNLIPLNPVKERRLSAPNRDTADAFLRRLIQNHISATRRRGLGDDIAGACGQLRRSRISAANEQRGEHK